MQKTAVSLPNESNNFWIDTQLWVSFCFTALALFYQIAFLNTIHTHVLYILFFTALGGYTFITQHANWIKNRKFYLNQVVVLVSLAFVVYHYFQLKDEFQIYTGIAISVISLLYEIYGFPYSIRKWPNFKIFYIAFIWSLYLVGFNLNSFDPLLLLSCFFFILAITIPFDIRDMRQDFPTLPRNLGIKKSKQISYLSIFLSFLFWYFLQVDYLCFFCFVFTLIAALIAIIPVNENTSKNYISFVIEGLSALPLLIYWGTTANTFL